MIPKELRMYTDDDSGASGFERSMSVNLAQRQQDFEFAERRARLVYEMARDLGVQYVGSELLATVLAEFMAAGK